MAAGVLGVALAAAGCGSTSNLGSGSTKGGGTSATNVSFGAENQQICGAGSRQPGYKNTIGTVPGAAKSLSGAGSTFVAPMMSQWASTYNKPTGVQVSYQSIGSGGGIIRASAEMLRLVPVTLHEASAALGVTRARTIMSVALPTALPGITTGVMLAVARAMGETAPLLLTTLGNDLFIQANPAKRMSGLPLQIFSNAITGFRAAQARAWAVP